MLRLPSPSSFLSSSSSDSPPGYVDVVAQVAAAVCSPLAVVDVSIVITVGVGVLVEATVTSVLGVMGSASVRRDAEGQL